MGPLGSEIATRAIDCALQKENLPILLIEDHQYSMTTAKDSGT